MRWFRRARHEPDPDPGTPHHFRQIDDPGMGAMASAQWGRGQTIAGIAVTDNFIRKSRCGVPGCGRERSDPIHHGGEA